MNYTPEMTEGVYGSFAIHFPERWPLWSCYESSDYHYYGVTDDFGNIVSVSEIRNMRGY